MGEPLTLTEAQKRNDWPDWKLAMDAEIDQLEPLGTWVKEKLPPDRKAINANGYID